MPRDEFPISTGVDGLVRLLKERGRLGLTEAAIELGISQSVVEEWATVLEKAGLIKIDYQFTKVYLSWADKAGKKDTDKKLEEVVQKQVMMGREAESQVKRIENLKARLDELREEFIKISEVYESKISGIRDRIDELINLERQFEEVSFRGREVSERFNCELGGVTARINEDEKRLGEMKKAKEELARDIEELKSKMEKLKKSRGGGK